jgi:hypothetical protein
MAAAWRILTTISLVGALLLAGTGVASAHHGWNHFDITRPLYVSGEVVSVRWANPHPEVRVRVDRDAPAPPDLASMPIPPELEEIGGREVLRATRAYDGDQNELMLVLAPTSRLESWGMADEVVVGEQVSAVGYVGVDAAQEFRPELLVREDGRAIRQRSVPLQEAVAQDTAQEQAEEQAQEPGAEPDTGSGDDGLLVVAALAVPVAAVLVGFVVWRWRKGRPR